MLSYGSERKEVFDDDKNVNFVKSEKKMGLSQRKSIFRQKIQNFCYCLFLKEDLEIMLSFGLKRNKAFQNSKNFNFVKSKK